MKPFWQSKTFWGSVVSAAMLLLGLNEGEVPFTATEISDSIVALIGAAAFGFTLYGRQKAQGSLSLR